MIKIKLKLEFKERCQFKPVTTLIWLFCLNQAAMAKFLPLQPENAYLSAPGYSPTTPFLICLLLVTLIIGKLFILYPTKQYQTCAMLAAQNPQKTAFVFDLHGVVFRFDPILALKDALQTAHKKKLFLAVINPFLIWDVLKLLHSSAVVEEAILKIGIKYPHLVDLVPLALQMANEQVPITPTIELIQQLKRNGFQLFVFSNIGEHSAQILKTKYPEIFDLFDGVLVTTAKDNYVMKPSEEAFTKFLNQFAVDKSKIIFIDDKQSNIHVARKLGIAAIQFFNPHQCRQLLQKIIPLHS